MGGVARRLDHEAADDKARGQAPGCREIIDDGCDAGVEIGENVHVLTCY